MNLLGLPKKSAFARSIGSGRNCAISTEVKPHENYLANSRFVIVRRANAASTAISRLPNALAPAAIASSAVAASTVQRYAWLEVGVSTLLEPGLAARSDYLYAHV